MGQVPLLKSWASSIIQLAKPAVPKLILDPTVVSFVLSCAAISQVKSNLHIKLDKLFQHGALKIKSKGTQIEMKR